MKIIRQDGDEVCALCGSPDRDLKSDHLRHCYKDKQDRLSPTMFKPRLFYTELNALQDGTNPICSNRNKCRDRQAAITKATKP